MKSELKRLWFRTKEKISQWADNDPLLIAPYISYANQNEIIVSGRVLENEGIVVKEDDGKWENFVNSLRRLETDEAKHVQIQLNYQNQIHNAKTDEEGYFNFRIPISQSAIINKKLTWLKVELKLPEISNENSTLIIADAKIMLPGTQNELAIITDIDDTILESHVDSFLKLKLLYETFFKNIHSRKSFDGIAEVLQKVCNPNRETQHPIFYLSHSPWNLYELLEQFLSKNNFPTGPLFLRDLGVKMGDERVAHKNHKKNTIEHLLSFYPCTNFILLGDATEHDIDIYLAAFKKFPKRILKIIIRAAEKEKKNARVKDIIVANPDAPVYLIEHSNEMLEIVEL